MSIKARGELLEPNDQVSLTVQYKDGYGDPVDADLFPTVTVVSPTGLVSFGPTSAGVERVSVGKYSFLYTVAYTPPYGVYQDVWVASIGGNRVETNFSFVVSHTDLPNFNSDGYYHLGDDPGTQYSQVAIRNINKLLKLLKRRLNSSGKVKSTDAHGNVVYLDCDIFSVDQLVTFLAGALWDFNQVPYFTYFQFDDDAFINQFGEILVEGATLYSLTSRALIEKGNELQVTDNGISFNLPQVSDTLGSQWSTTLSNYWDKLKYIKNSIRPQPKSLGIFSMGSGANPAVRRLRHLRERKIL
jgi:hypothetical protein